MTGAIEIGHRRSCSCSPTGESWCWTPSAAAGPPW